MGTSEDQARVAVKATKRGMDQQFRRRIPLDIKYYHTTQDAPAARTSWCITQGASTGDPALRPG